MTPGGLLVLVLLVCMGLGYDCQHDHHARNLTKHFLNDLTEGRLLQGAETGK